MEEKPSEKHVHVFKSFGQVMKDDFRCVCGKDYHVTILRDLRKVNQALEERNDMLEEKLKAWEEYASIVHGNQSQTFGIGVSSVAE